MKYKQDFLDIIKTRKIIFSLFAICLLLMIVLFIVLVKTIMQNNKINETARSYTTVFDRIETNITSDNLFVLKINDFEKSNFRIIVTMTSKDDFSGRCILLQGEYDAKDFIDPQVNLDDKEVIFDEKYDFKYILRDDKTEIFGSSHFFTPGEIKPPATLLFLSGETSASVVIEIEQMKTSWDNLEVLFNKRTELITRQVLIIFALFICFLLLIILVFFITK